MPTIYFGSVSKRSNSTKQHSDSVECEVQIKHPSTKWNPVFLIATTDDFTYHPDTYNSVTWNDRQYYIDDISYVHHNLWEVHCSIDYLATWKSEIGSTSGFILYSTNTYNTGIPDTRLSTTRAPNIDYNSYYLWNSSESGVYVVNYIGDGDCPTVYVDESNLKLLKQAVWEDDTLLEMLIDNSDYTSRKINNVTDSLVSCIYLPITPDSSGTTNITLCQYETGVVGHTISHNMETIFELAIPFGYGDFRDRSQYTSLTLMLPGYGALDLNPDDFLGSSDEAVSAGGSNFDETIDIHVCLDPYVGDITYLINDFIKCTGNIAVQVPISTVSQGNVIGSVAGGVVSMGSSVAGGLISGGVGGMIAGAVTGGISMYNSCMSNMQHNLGTVGSNGGASAWNVNTNEVRITRITHPTTVTPSSTATLYGRPYNGIGTVSSAGGYVQMANAHVACDAPKSINDLIDNELNGGLFYE